MKESKDNFSVQSDIYATYRPGYPDELFEWIYSHCRHFGRALDCATGNGQAAIKLASKFEMVNAIDLSISQLNNAYLSSSINYSVGKVEDAAFPEDSFDLITVAQALHWFDHEIYFRQMYKLIKPGGFFAAWGYNLLNVNDEIDAVVRKFYTEIVGPYWDVERQHVDNNYNTIPYPFTRIPAPEFTIIYTWKIEHMIGYINTWSAVQHYIKNNNSNPVDIISKELADVWAGEERVVTFPIFMLAGYLKEKE